SPAISPRLPPQQVAEIQAQGNALLLDQMNSNGFNAAGQGVLSGQEPFPNLQHEGLGEMGQANQMEAPEIQIDFAGPSKIGTFEPQNHQDVLNHDTLSP